MNLSNEDRCIIFTNLRLLNQHMADLSKAIGELTQIQKDMLVHLKLANSPVIMIEPTTCYSCGTSSKLLIKSKVTPRYFCEECLKEIEGL